MKNKLSHYVLVYMNLSDMLEQITLYNLTNSTFECLNLKDYTSEWTGNHLHTHDKASIQRFRQMDVLDEWWA